MELIIRKDAMRVAREVVRCGFWKNKKQLSEADAEELSKDGTLYWADLSRLEKLVGRKLTRDDYWLWETSLRKELTRLAPIKDKKRGKV